MKAVNDNKWFEKLRVNSWEVEILIVAVILAALFQIPDFITDKLSALAVSSHQDFRGYNVAKDSPPFWIILGIVKLQLYYILSLSFSIAKVTFSSYIFFRGFWVAIIGLSSVFSKGINHNSLNYSSYFNKLLPEDSFDGLISKLDNICSSIFSLGFLIAFYVASILIYLCFAILFLGSFDYLSAFLHFPDIVLQVVFSIIMILGAIFFIDIILSGVLKKVKWKVFSYPYSKIYNLLRIITGFFLYEAVYYLFISNVSRKVVFMLWLIFALYISATIFSDKSKGYLTFPYDTLTTESFMSKDHYEDRLLASGDNFSSTKYPFINSEIISENYLKIYIPFHPYMHSSLDSACGITNREEGSTSYQSLINCINSQYVIYIDNDTIVSNFVFYDYSANDVSIKTFFIPIPIKEYQEGKHVITIETLFYKHYDMYEIEDSTEDPDSWFFEDDNYYGQLSRGEDSLIHIPFYIYR